jgi:hypothetical protein
MRFRLFAWLGAALAVFSTGPAEGQSKPKWTAPLTRDGQPDLEGVWLSNAATPLERPPELKGRELLTGAEVAELKRRADRIFAGSDSDYAAGDSPFLSALANSTVYKNPIGATGGAGEMIDREFDGRTSLIIDPPDGRIPALTPEGQRRQTAALQKSLLIPHPPPERPEDLSNYLRCITYGVPRLGGNFGAGHYSYYQIEQTRGYVVLFMETIHDARIIPLDGRPHLPATVRTWNGDSRGHWEGQTLVVDTTNFSPQSSFMGAAENLHLIERFTRVAPDEIDQQITLDDPTTWARPWTAMVRLKRTPERLFEFACHEGNLPMFGILRSARESEKLPK